MESRSKELHQLLKQASVANKGAKTDAEATKGAAEELFQRLQQYPQEFETLGPDVWRAYEKTLRQKKTTLISAPAAPVWGYRNVELSWVPAEVEWRWPPQNVFDDYDTLVANANHLHVIGQGWGMSAITHPKTNGSVVLTGDYLDPPGARVDWSGATSLRCFLGATYNEAHDFLYRRGDAENLPNAPGFSGLTFAGNIGVGGHGSSLHLGSLESMVNAVEIGAVDGGGQTKTFKRGDADFDLAVTHLGRLGPVVSLDIEVQKAFRIGETREIKKLGAGASTWEKDLESLVQQAIADQTDPTVHSIEIWIAPYPDNGVITVAYGKRMYSTKPLSTGVKRPPALRCDALLMLGFWGAMIIDGLAPSLIRGTLVNAVKLTETPKEVVMTAREGLDFGAPNNQDMTSIEAAFDLSNVADAVGSVVATLKKIDDLALTKDLYVFSPLGLRFVGQGAASGLSMQAGRSRTLHLEIPTFAHENFDADKVLPEIQTETAKQRGRPHWGQRVSLTPNELLALWPVADFKAMRDLAKSLDPNGRFENPLLDPIFALVPP